MFTRFRLMNEANGLGDDGGTPPPADPSTPPPADPNAPPADDFVVPEWANGFTELDREILGDPSLKPITNIQNLVKSYVHGQRQMGKKGVIIPSENSTKEEWDTFYQKVGVPLEEAKYNETTKLTEDNVLGEEFNKGFLKLAHESRVAPAQAAKLYDYFNSQVKATSENTQTQTAAQMQAELNTLRDTWGEDAYSVKTAKAAAFLKENDPELLAYLGKTGLNKNAAMVKSLINLAEKFGGEDLLPTGNTVNGMTIDDMNKEINNAFNPADPYMNSNHADHKRRVEEVQGYYAKIEKLNSRK